MKASVRCDHVGHTPLHVAIISNSADIALDGGARITARLVGGRSAHRMRLEVLSRRRAER